MKFSVSEQTLAWIKEANLPLWFEPSTTSTNTIAKENLSEDDFRIYLTDHQTQGRGRGQNIWQDKTEGAQLLSTWSFKTSQVPQPVLSPLIGLAVFNALQTTWPYLAWSLKAPNDIYLNDKKVAGLLIEMLTQGDQTRVLVGLGLNVWEGPDLQTSTSIAAALKSLAAADAEIQGEIQIEVQIEIQIEVQQWRSFLARLLTEFSLCFEQFNDELKKHQTQSLLWALNRFPSLREKYTQVQNDGSLVTATQKIHWSQL